MIGLPGRRPRARRSQDMCGDPDLRRRPDRL